MNIKLSEGSEAKAVGQKKMYPFRLLFIEVKMQKSFGEWPRKDKQGFHH